MIRSDFPDIKWLKSMVSGQIKVTDPSGKLIKPKWPNCIINATTSSAYRPDVQGPISIFMNISGNSYCSTGGPTATISDDFFYVTNKNQEYTLTIEPDQPAETLNIHLGEDLSLQVLSGLITPTDQILNDSYGLTSENIGFANRLYRKDDTLAGIVKCLYADHKNGNLSSLKLDEYNYQLMVYLLSQHRQILKEVRKLPAAKASTRIELHRRLSYSLDYLHSHQNQSIDLQKLADEAFLSKYHFLRLFKVTFGCSPYQYLQRLRLQRAFSLLKSKEIPVNQIAIQLGFENATSFSRLFFQRFGASPTRYRRSLFA
ncbi:AraC family transcriptional regulator [uncultured Imperialibacter sp.]|uniref:helix-turn-helix domain-containing protein n=1 Tax=uncultured Imperialibacter sp. TaxID=1672639 RepID=UPI0030DAC3A2|tara:strand:+ start:119 stop:1063 length:945 start_codon:yes stop_codon:yes gene_type:complete